MNISQPPLLMIAMVGLSGLEPPTSRLSGARSNQLSYKPMIIWCFSFILFPFATFVTGGDDGIRTHDPLLAGQVLSQLSYTPIMRFPLRGVGTDLFSRAVSS